MYTLIHWLIHSVNMHWLSVFLVLSGELGIRHKQDLDPATPPQPPPWRKWKADASEQSAQRCKCGANSQNQNRTDVPKPFVLVSILRASPAQAPQSPGDDVRPLFCWWTEIGLLRCKKLYTALAHWVVCGNGWDFLLFAKAFEGRWDGLRLKLGHLLGVHEICLSSLAGWDSVEGGVCATYAFACKMTNAYFWVNSQKKTSMPLDSCCCHL